jgi:hypothetical protein
LILARKSLTKRLSARIATAIRAYSFDTSFLYC